MLQQGSVEPLGTMGDSSLWGGAWNSAGGWAQRGIRVPRLGGPGV